MKSNRSISPVTVIPVLTYPDVHAAGAAHATIVDEPTDHMYGERQYSAQDLAGHRWTFTESIADVAPEEYGCTTVEAWRHP